MDERLTPRELGLLTVPGDVWTLILIKLHPKDAIIFVMAINKLLRQYLAEKVNWLMFLRRDFEDFVRIEKQCKESYTARHNVRSSYPQYTKPLAKRTPFAKYYVLLREEHENEFGMPSYGTCDSPQQLAEVFPKYCGAVYMSDVLRSKQPKERGWRWHKYGGYYGKLRPKTVGGRCFQPEYLAQANGKHGNPRIDVTWVFSRHDDGRGIKYVFEKGVVVTIGRR